MFSAHTLASTGQNPSRYPGFHSKTSKLLELAVNRPENNVEFSLLGLSHTYLFSVHIWRARASLCAWRRFRSTEILDCPRLNLHFCYLTAKSSWLIFSHLSPTYRQSRFPQKFALFAQSLPIPLGESRHPLILFASFAEPFHSFFFSSQIPRIHLMSHVNEKLRPQLKQIIDKRRHQELSAGCRHIQSWSETWNECLVVHPGRWSALSTQDDAALRVQKDMKQMMNCFLIFLRVNQECACVSGNRIVNDSSKLTLPTPPNTSQQNLLDPMTPKSQTHN